MYEISSSYRNLIFSTGAQRCQTARVSPARLSLDKFRINLAGPEDFVITLYGFIVRNCAINGPPRQEELFRRGKPHRFKLRSLLLSM
jgi:hypothetical protein